MLSILLRINPFDSPAPSHLLFPDTVHSVCQVSAGSLRATGINEAWNQNWPLSSLLAIGLRTNLMLPFRPIFCFSRFLI